jgi:hypothetical protein
MVGLLAKMTRFSGTGLVAPSAANVSRLDRSIGSGSEDGAADDSSEA